MNDDEYFNDARVHTIINAVVAAAWHHRNDENSCEMLWAVREILTPALKHPEAAHGWVRVPVQRIHAILMLIDPAPATGADGKTYVFRNPLAAEVLTKLSAEVHALTDAMKGAKEPK
jgi:hypothetical protein